MSQGPKFGKDIRIVKPADSKAEGREPEHGKTHHVFQGSFQHLMNFKMPTEVTKSLGKPGLGPWKYLGASKNVFLSSDFITRSPSG